MNTKPLAILFFVITSITASVGVIACATTKAMQPADSAKVEDIDKQIDAVTKTPLHTQAELDAANAKIASLMQERDAAIKQGLETQYGGIFDTIASFIPLPISQPLKQTLLALAPLAFPRPRKVLLTAVADVGTHVGDAIASSTTGDIQSTLASVGKAVISPVSGVAKAIGLMHTTPAVKSA